MMMYRNDIQLQTKGKGGASPRNSLFVFGTMLRRGKLRLFRYKYRPREIPVGGIFAYLKTES